MEKIKIKDFDCISLDDLTESKENAIRQTTIDSTKKMSVISDVMWKTMFQNTNRLKYSCKLISYFVDISYEYLLDHLKLASNEFNKDKIFTKSQRGDYVADINGSKINIEVNNFANSFDRNTDYTYKLFNKEVRISDNKKGNKNNNYTYTNVLQINLNNFSFKEIDDYYEIYTLKSNKNDYVLTNKIIIIEIYLPLIRKKWYNVGTEKLSELERFLLTIYEEDISKAKELGGKVKIMEDYVKEATMVSKDDDLIEAYDKEWSNYEGYKALGIKEGFQQGIEQGVKQGIKENKIETVKNMMKENIDMSTISKVTGLSIDEVKSIEAS